LVVMVDLKEKQRVAWRVALMAESMADKRVAWKV